MENPSRGEADGATGGCPKRKKIEKREKKLDAS